MRGSSPRRAARPRAFRGSEDRAAPAPAWRVRFQSSWPPRPSALRNPWSCSLAPDRCAARALPLPPTKKPLRRTPCGIRCSGVAEVGPATGRGERSPLIVSQRLLIQVACQVEQTAISVVFPKAYDHSPPLPIYLSVSIAALPDCTSPNNFALHKAWLFFVRPFSAQGF